LRSAAAVLMGVRPNFSTRTLSTVGERKAGKAVKGNSVSVRRHLGRDALLPGISRLSSTVPGSGNRDCMP
jgi:hypothetical protein